MEPVRPQHGLQCWWLYRVRNARQRDLLPAGRHATDARRTSKRVVSQSARPAPATSCAPMFLLATPPHVSAGNAERDDVVKSDGPGGFTGHGSVASVSGHTTPSPKQRSSAIGQSEDPPRGCPTASEACLDEGDPEQKCPVPALMCASEAPP